MPANNVPDRHLWCRAYIDNEVARRKAAQPSPERTVLVRQVYRACEMASDILGGRRGRASAKELKAILRMRFVEGMSFREVSEELFIPPWRVRYFETEILDLARWLLADNVTVEAA